MTLVHTDPITITFQSLHPREEQARVGTATRLSFSGVVITAPDLPPLGAILQLNIPVREKELRMFAEVKWHRPDDDPQSFGAFFLMPTTGRMLDLIDLHIDETGETGED